MRIEKNKIRSIHINSETSFGIFYTTYFSRFVRYAYYYVNDWQTAEDMTHDALLYYWENRDKLSPETDVLGYILLTVKNKCINWLKHLQVKMEYSKQYADLYDWEVNIRLQTLEDESYSSIFSQDIMQIITKELSALPKQTQEIFLLNFLENIPRREIAAQMKVSQQKVDYHINNANKFLAQKLKDYIPFLFLFLD